MHFDLVMQSCFSDGFNTQLLRYNLKKKKKKLKVGKKEESTTKSPSMILTDQKEKEKKNRYLQWLIRKCQVSDSFPSSQIKRCTSARIQNKKVQTPGLFSAQHMLHSCLMLWNSIWLNQLTSSVHVLSSHFPYISMRKCNKTRCYQANVTNSCFAYIQTQAFRKQYYFSSRDWQRKNNPCRPTKNDQLYNNSFFSTVGSSSGQLLNMVSPELRRISWAQITKSRYEILFF